MRFNGQNKGQALVELGIFGAILLMLVGVLISYILRNDINQRITQVAFRRALHDVDRSDGFGTRPSTHLMVYDKHIPDPGNIFGRGQAVPFTASASVSRDVAMLAPIQEERDLPIMNIDIKGDPPPSGTSGPFQNADILTLQATAAGFGYAHIVTEGAVEKFKEIFGSVYAWCSDCDKCRDNGYLAPFQNCNGGCWVPPDSDDADREGEAPGNVWIADIERPYSTIQVLDYCLGEIYSYDSCKLQCKEISEEGLDGMTDYDLSYCQRLPAKKEEIIGADTEQITTQAGGLKAYVTGSGISAVDDSYWSVETKRKINTSGGQQEVSTIVSDGEAAGP